MALLVIHLSHHKQISTFTYLPTYYLLPTTYYLLPTAYYYYYY